MRRARGGRGHGRNCRGPRRRARGTPGVPPRGNGLDRRSAHRPGRLRAGRARAHRALRGNAKLLRPARGHPRALPPPVPRPRRGASCEPRPVLGHPARLRASGGRRRASRHGAAFDRIGPARHPDPDQGGERSGGGGSRGERPRREPGRSAMDALSPGHRDRRDGAGRSPPSGGSGVRRRGGEQGRHGGAARPAIRVQATLRPEPHLHLRARAHGAGPASRDPEARAIRALSRRPALFPPHPRARRRDLRRGDALARVPGAGAGARYQGRPLDLPPPDRREPVPARAPDSLATSA